MNEQHIGFILWVCLYPISIAIVRLIYHFIRKSTPTITLDAPQDLEKIKQKAKNTLTVGCVQLISFWTIAYLLW